MAFCNGNNLRPVAGAAFANAGASFIVYNYIALSLIQDADRRLRDEHLNCLQICSRYCKERIHPAELWPGLVDCADVPFEQTADWIGWTHYLSGSAPSAVNIIFAQLFHLFFAQRNVQGAAARAAGAAEEGCAGGEVEFHRILLPVGRLFSLLRFPERISKVF